MKKGKTIKSRKQIKKSTSKIYCVIIREQHITTRITQNNTEHKMSWNTEHNGAHSLQSLRLPTFKLTKQKLS